MARYITLGSNGQRFAVLGPIIHRKVAALADVVRQSGRTRLDSLTARQSFVFPAPTGGMGLRRIPTDRIDDPTMARRTWDSKADTRHDAGVTLPLFPQDSTEPTLSGDILYSLRFTLKFKGSLWGFWDGEDVGTTQGASYAASYGGSGTTWGTANLIATSGTAGTFIIPIWGTVVGNQMVVLFARGDDHLFYRSSDGSTWNAASTQPTANMLVNVVTQSERINAGVCTTIGDTVYTFLWDEDNDEIEAWQSTDSGDIFTAISGAIVAPGGGPAGAAAYIDLQGDASACFSTREGIYALDSSASTVQKLRDLLQDDNTGNGLTRWSNPVTGTDGLYVGTGDGDTAEFIYLGGSGSAAKTIEKSVGLIGGDGLVTDKRGFVHWMEASPLWLFYLYGGDASGRNGWIGAFNGLGSLPLSKGAGHHFMWQDTTANRITDRLALTNADDGTMRLHLHIHPTLAEGTPAFDATSNGTVSAASNITVEHTCTGSNRILVVWVAGNQTTSAVTYNTVSMTQLGTNQSSGGLLINAWYLVNPATGAHNIVATHGSGANALVAMSFTAVDQVSPITAAVESAASGQTSRTVAPFSRSNTMTVAGICHQTNEVHTPNTGDTERSDVGTTNLRISCNHQAGSGTTTTVGASWSTSDDAAIIGATLVGAISNQGDTQFLAEPLAAPDSGVTRRFVNPTASGGGSDTGYIERPETNMGMPRDQGAFIALFTEARDLSSSTSGEFINENYEVDGSSPTTNIGDIVSGTLELSLASGAGVTFRSLQIREELDRDSGSATQTPLLVATEIMYVKHIAPLNLWEFTIDIKNADVPEVEPGADLITALETVLTNVPRQAFQPRPGGTTFYVTTQILGYEEQEGYAEGPEENVEPNVVGIRVRLQEVV